jgi:DNA-binding NarL/FixJ family response regulator
MDEIRILIADDHTLLGNALAELLGGEEGFDVVAVAGSAAETVRLAAEYRPHAVLLDIEMPGNEHPPITVRQLQQVVPGVRILILTMHDDAVLAQSMLPLGICAFLHKTVTHQALSVAVRSACSPGSLVTVSLSTSTLLPRDAVESGPLSPREEEVIALAAQGLSNCQIARRLNIVEGTVKRHMRSIFDKLEACSRVGAANKAVELGLIPPPVSSPRRRLIATGNAYVGALRSPKMGQMPIPIPPPTGSNAPVM